MPTPVLTSRNDAPLDTEAALDRGLKDTFPAPRSATASKEPLVDQALTSTGSGVHSAPSLDPKGEKLALKAKIDSLKAAISEVGASSVRVARAHADDALETTRARIRVRPVAAAAIAAAIGFVWGATR